jgi:hypothetical protein
MYCLLSCFYLLFQLTVEGGLCIPLSLLKQTTSMERDAPLRVHNAYSDINLIMPVKSAVGQAGCLTTLGYNILSPFLILPANSTNYGRRTLYFNLSLVMKRDAPLCVRIQTFT